jgi:hypothetical protein
LSDARQDVDERFPTLARVGYQIMSPRDGRYNCVAWVLRDRTNWWEPALDGAFWPRKVSEEELENGDLPEYERVFRGLGYERCSDDSLVPGLEKIAVYANEDEFAHVSYQRADGTWSSKLGKLNDVKHANASSVSGPAATEYPSIKFFMARTRQPHELADSESGLLLPSTSDQ